jgi:hypothetical protein
MDASKPLQEGKKRMRKATPGRQVNEMIMETGAPILLHLYSSSLLHPEFHVRNVRRQGSRR